MRSTIAGWPVTQPSLQPGAMVLENYSRISNICICDLKDSGDLSDHQATDSEQKSQILTVSRRMTRPSVSIERYDGTRESRKGNPEDFDIGSEAYIEVGL
jgi:hypothetical protein